MRKAVRRFAWPIAIAVVAVGFWLYGASRPLTVETAVVARGKIEEYVTEEAETQLDVERVVTADRPGTLLRIALEEGDHVAAGQVVTSIEDTELKLMLAGLDARLEEIQGLLAGVDVPLPKESQIAAAEKERLAAQAELQTLKEQTKAAQAGLTLAEREFARVARLFQDGTSTERQHDQAESALAVAQARLEALKHRVEAGGLAVETAGLHQKVLQESLHDTAHLRQVYAAQKKQVQQSRALLTHEAHIRSPIDGIVLEKYVDSEQFVQPGAPLLLVGDPHSIEIRSDILSDEVRRVRPGQKVLLVGKAIEKPGATGRVRKIFPAGFTKISSLGVRQQRVSVLVDFANSALNLGPGYELDVKIVVGSNDNAVLVPAAAVYAAAEGAAVFVVEGGRARSVSVEIGLRGEDAYEVVSGPNEGDVVILRPPPELEEGSRVRPAEHSP